MNSKLVQDDARAIMEVTLGEGDPSLSQFVAVARYGAKVHLSQFFSRPTYKFSAYQDAGMVETAYFDA